MSATKAKNAKTKSMKQAARQLERLFWKRRTLLQTQGMFSLKMNLLRWRERERSA